MTPPPGDWRAMVVTDLDGTLLDSASRLGARNRAALEALGAGGVLRVVATGRNLHSLLGVVGAELPVDYVVFSTGGGTLAWPSAELLGAFCMRGSVAAVAVRVLVGMGLDFMALHAIPDNHHFHFRRAGGANPDFERRLARYARWAHPWREPFPDGVRVSQLLAIEPPDAPSRIEALARALPGANVVRTTSPLDHVSRWIEIFPAQVSKARAAERLRRRLRIAHATVVAVGNDWNDADLLAWAARPAVVANAPEGLRRRFPVVASNDDAGFAEAVAGV